MNRALAARIERLERRKANQAPMRQFGVFGREPIWRTEERGGVVYCLPLHSGDAYSELARNQQQALLARLNEYADQFDEEGNSDGRDTSPHVGIELAPLLPGKTKRPRFVEIDGQEIDAEAWRALKAQRN
ncbi:hypothetical protein [Rhodovulum strictum]|uniref:Uncharacterized protein n=1 Tax=Rhodovulum strictum TaxID=58314 RepID=A0A844B7T5_9RHOB|nr:hypothetical protein [Rhodovulum strictum]MRH22436.1 hypothetical protein [Rhodovulum strictum]